MSIHEEKRIVNGGPHLVTSQQNKQFLIMGKATEQTVKFKYI